jgi:DNA-binding XRE family transcriptional regulator
MEIPMPKPQGAAIAQPAEQRVVTKAALRAAAHLDVSAKKLAAIIGVSEATISRMKKGEFTLEQGSKPFELAVLFIRLFRSLDAIVGGDEAVARAWLQNINTILGGAPVETIQTIFGLVDAIAYLDARRALV